MIYDVAIAGAGAVGAAAAWKLSHYALRTVLLERGKEACSGVSKANSGIVHGGFHYPLTTLKGRLELRGNHLFSELEKELHFPFRRNGILLAAFTEEELAQAEKLFERGKANGVPGIEFCSRERMLELEKKLSPRVLGGVHAPKGGVVEPYRYVFSLVESAVLNGVDFLTEFEVRKAERAGENWKIAASDGRQVEARYVINAAGLYADELSRIFGGETFTIVPRKGEEYLLDRESAARPEKVVFPVPTGHTKGVLVIPTADGTTMVGPTAEIVEDKSDSATTAENRKKIFESARKMVPSVSEKDLITAFSGSRPVLEGNDDFYVALSEKTPHFVQAAGIQSPGLTASPAIAEYMAELLAEDGLELKEKAEPRIPVPELPAIRHCTPEEADRLHEKDPAWTNIICRCERISEAEIVAAIREGHVTVDGIKFRTRAGMGRCQGGFCSYRILKIIARETGLSMEELSKKGGNSRYIFGHIGKKA